MARPLLPFPPESAVGILRRRVKRFIIEFSLHGRECLAHSNNSGSMLGLVREGNPILVSPAAAAGRKLPYTLELVGLPGPRLPDQGGAVDAVRKAPFAFSPPGCPPCLWVGVNTLTPNRLLRAAFAAGRLPWAKGYRDFKAEAGRGQSRLDALLTGPACTGAGASAFS
jgi:sugar fermentation stimulation protein A